MAEMPPIRRPGVTRKQLMQALARGYCNARNTKKEMDIDLVVAMADEVQKIIEGEYGSLPTGEDGNGVQVE